MIMIIVVIIIIIIIIIIITVTITIITMGINDSNIDNDNDNIIQYKFDLPLLLSSVQALLHCLSTGYKEWRGSCKETVGPIGYSRLICGLFVSYKMKIGILHIV